jgi:hypothetical protein
MTEQQVPCPRCRYENPPGNRFCGSCGVQLISGEQLARRQEHSPVQAGRAWPAKQGAGCGRGGPGCRGRPVLATAQDRHRRAVLAACLPRRRLRLGRLSPQPEPGRGSRWGMGGLTWPGCRAARGSIVHHHGADRQEKVKRPSPKPQRSLCSLSLAGEDGSKPPQTPSWPRSGLSTARRTQRHVKSPSNGSYVPQAQADQASLKRPGAKLLLPLPSLFHSAAPKGGSCGGNKSSPIPRACVLPRVNNLVFGHPIESFPNGLKGTVAGPIP